MPHRELLESFIEEAAEVLSGLEHGVAGLRLLSRPSLEASPTPSTHAPNTHISTTAERLNDLSILAHRLRGSAALYGYVQLSTLASLQERLLGTRPQLSGEQHQEFLSLLEQVNGTLRQGLSRLQAGGNDHDLGLLFARSGGATTLQRLLQQRPDAFQMRASRLHHATPPGEDDPEQAAGLSGAELTVDRQVQVFARENAEVWEYFAPEVHEHLASLREQLGRGEDADLQVMFRAAHTIKGSAYMVGLPPLGDFAHSLEDLLGAAREGAVGLSSDVRHLIAEATDTIGDLLTVGGGAPGTALPAQLASVSARLRLAHSGEPAPAPLAAPNRSATAQDMVGQASGNQATGNQASGNQPQAAATSIRVPAARLEGLMEQLGELVTARARMTRLLSRLDELQGSMTASQERFQRTVRDFEERYLNPDMVRTEGAALSSSPMGGLGFSQQFAELEFNTYNDLNILSRSITELSADFAEVRRRLSDTATELSEENEQLGKLVRRLRLDVNQTSRVAFSQATARLRRWVREQQAELTLQVEGEDVQIESGILQRISDPLLHLLTNAAHHGLSGESEEGRRAAGKPPQGTVWIRAAEQGNFLEVTVADDGQGLDYARIRERALERGLRSAQELDALSQEQLGRLVLLPGFSTAREVGHVAGRGVGLDVVATAVRQLGGELLISSERGVGTAFTLRLPTTQRIMDVLHIDLGGGHRAALPVGSIRSLRDVPVSELRRDAGGSWLDFGGESVPVVDARPLWGQTPDPADPEARLVVASSISTLIAVRVHDFGEIEEVAVTAPGGLLAPLDHLAGMAVSGTGQVLAILDPAGVLRLSRRPEAWLGQTHAPAQASAKRRLLLVDDSLSVRRLVGRMLERGGYQVVTASDGQEALDLLQQDADFGAVVTDLEMSRVNGYELLAAVRARPETAGLPLLVMTTRAGEKHQRLAFQLGADDYFTKPVNEALLLRRLSTLRRSQPEVSA